MERLDQSGVASFFWSQRVAVGETATLTGALLQHLRVRRVRAGDPVRLVDGLGTVASGSVGEAGKTRVTVTIATVEQQPRPVPLEALVPVADRERMLWAAEKCVELQVTSWRPVMFARSRSVSRRGEGTKFAERIQARMRGALEQSGGAWLPEVYAVAEFAEALQAVPTAYARLLLDAAGSPAAALCGSGPTALAVGPEGGMERRETESALALGWRAASLGSNMLRFETAIIAGAAVVRAAQLPARSV